MQGHGLMMQSPPPGSASTKTISPGSSSLPGDDVSPMGSTCSPSAMSRDSVSSQGEGAWRIPSPCGEDYLCHCCVLCQCIGADHSHCRATGYGHYGQEFACSFAPSHNPNDIAQHPELYTPGTITPEPLTSSDANNAIDFPAEHSCTSATGYDHYDQECACSFAPSHNPNDILAAA